MIRALTQPDPRVSDRAMDGIRPGFGVRFGPVLEHLGLETCSDISLMCTTPETVEMVRHSLATSEPRPPPLDVTAIMNALKAHVRLDESVSAVADAGEVGSVSGAPHPTLSPHLISHFVLSRAAEDIVEDPVDEAEAE